MATTSITRTRIGLTALTVAMLTAVGVGTAAASPAPNRALRAAPVSLHLTVSNNLTLDARILTCPTAGGNSHPNPVAACAELRRVDGYLDDLAADANCTTEYQPVVAAARGHWYGRPIQWQQMFANSCELAASTGSIFQF